MKLDLEPSRDFNRGQRKEQMLQTEGYVAKTQRLQSVECVQK